jgi:hypothetical protein|nr:MAG TPA: hypothetical protein [Caudoviricetes sp.]
MDENTLDRLEALERDTRVDSLRLDGVRARYNEILAKVKMLEYEKKRLNQSTQATRNELVRLKRVAIKRRKKEGGNV